MEWILTIILLCTVGIGCEPVQFTGPTRYQTLSTCMQIGEEAAAWLAQDFVTVTFQCTSTEVG